MKKVIVEFRLDEDNEELKDYIREGYSLEKVIKDSPLSLLEADEVLIRESVKIINEV